MAGPDERSHPDPEVARAIRARASSLANLLRVDADQRHDFEQELWLFCLRKLHLHDPRRGKLSTFLDRVLRNEVINMIEKWNTDKRTNERRAMRWDDPVSEAESLTLEEVYSHENYFGETGFGPRPESESLDVDTQVQLAIRRLPADLQQVAVVLMSSSVSEAARKLGIPRATLYGKLSQIEKVLAEAGLAPTKKTKSPRKPRRAADSSDGSSGK